MADSFPLANFPLANELTIEENLVIFFPIIKKAGRNMIVSRDSYCNHFAYSLKDIEKRQVVGDGCYLSHRALPDSYGQRATSFMRSHCLAARALEKINACRPDGNVTESNVN